MKAKATLILCVLMGIAPVAFMSWYGWDSSHNRGFQFGYFGDFNRIRHALTGTPGVSITRDWVNNDVRLEEFAFHITTSGGESLHLAFEEADPLRNASGEQLSAALIARIQQKTRPLSPTQ
jgi:hypothetical protein